MAPRKFHEVASVIHVYNDVSSVSATIIPTSDSCKSSYGKAISYMYLQMLFLACNGSFI